MSSGIRRTSKISVINQDNPTKTTSAPNTARVTFFANAADRLRMSPSVFKC